jgi:paraquat-inducible protein B
MEPIKALDIQLLATKLDALQPQSPVFYRGIQVSEVFDCRLSDDTRAMLIHARIDKGYAPLVRMNSRFWNARGIDFISVCSAARKSARNPPKHLSVVALPLPRLRIFKTQ